MGAETLDQIHAAIPHRGHMLLVDRIVQEDDSTITCEKSFTGEEFFFQGHYPDYPLCPGVILCECGAQTGAILLSRKLEDDGNVPVLTKMENVRFKRMVHPGETIQMQVTLDEQLSNAFYLTAKVTCEGKLAVRFSFVCTTAPRPGSA